MSSAVARVDPIQWPAWVTLTGIFTFRVSAKHVIGDFSADIRVEFAISSW